MFTNGAAKRRFGYAITTIHPTALHPGLEYHTVQKKVKFYKYKVRQKYKKRNLL